MSQDTTSPAAKWAKREQERRQKAMEQFMALLKKPEHAEVLSAFQTCKEVGCHL
jgi:hypothetical protein